MAPTDLPSTDDPGPVPDGPHEWHRLLGADELAGRVTTVEVGRRTLCVSSVDGSFGVLDNGRPHQGGPGEGTIEKGWWRCPWHGYDYSPCNGRPPVGFDHAPDAYAVEVRDGDARAAVPPQPPRLTTVSDVLVETMTNWGVEAVFGTVGHSNLGFAAAMRVAEEAGQLRALGIRHEGAAAFAASAPGKLTGRSAAYFRIAGPGSTNLLTGQQRAAHLDVWQTPLQNPDFAALRRRPTSAKASVAELCGACGLNVRVSGELDDALADALAANDPALVHVRTDVRLV